MNDSQIAAKILHHRKTVVVIEDDPDIGELLVEYLRENKHYHVILVADAREALQIVQGVQPDLFMIDHLLPGMNGLEVYDLLHSRKGFETIPALIISAGVLAHEVSDRHLPFLQKPFTLEELDYFLETLLP